jgi:hypothetical protein
MEEIMEMDLETQNKHLLVELLREKSKEESSLMLSVLRKMPWVFDETLRKRKKELIKRRRERKERRLRSNGKHRDSVWERRTGKYECVRVNGSIIKVRDSIGQFTQQSLESQVREFKLDYFRQRFPSEMLVVVQTIRDKQLTAYQSSQPHEEHPVLHPQGV